MKPVRMKQRRPTLERLVVAAPDFVMKFPRTCFGVTLVALMLWLVVSVFETPYDMYAWPRLGGKLPAWAKKKRTLVNHNDASVPEVCFVHVGKTAGSTLACMLGYDYEGCESTAPLTEAYLTHATRHLLKNMFNDCRIGTQYYLFATQNPLERIKSWFAYERPVDEFDLYYRQKKPLFVDCPFETISDVAERGLSTNMSHGTSKACRRRARDAIQGNIPFTRHNYYNYRYYLGQTPHDAKLYVVRSEHLANDWNSVERHLHGMHNRREQSGSERREPFLLDTTVPRKNKSKYSKEDRVISREAENLLCNALCQEIQVYKRIVERAINLRREEIQRSFDELKESCPTEAMSRTCPVLRS